MRAARGPVVQRWRLGVLALALLVQPSLLGPQLCRGPRGPLGVDVLLFGVFALGLVRLPGGDAEPLQALDGDVRDAPPPLMKRPPPVVDEGVLPQPDAVHAARLPQRPRVQVGAAVLLGPHPPVQDQLRAVPPLKRPRPPQPPPEAGPLAAEQLS